MNALSKPELIVGTVEKVNFVNEPIPALPIITKTHRFYAWMDRWTQSSYEAWEKSGRPEREF